MAVKTFSSEVLTSGDVNTYLANSGLVYVKSQTIGTGVSSVAVTSAFSSTYDNYKIVVSGGTSTAANSLSVKFGSTTTGYNFALMYASYAGTSSQACGANTTQINYVGLAAISGIVGNFEVGSPNLPTVTQVSAPYFDSTNAGHMSAYLNNTTQYTDFTLGVLSGVLTGGTITVYGYRKA